MIDSDLKAIYKFNYKGFIVCVYEVNDLISGYGYIIFENSEILIEDYQNMYDIKTCKDNAITDIDNEIDRETKYNG